jgi:hypothetical protein
MLDAVIGVSRERRSALIFAKSEIPPVVSIRALIDTGASATCVDPSVMRSLKLTPTGTISILTPSTKNDPVEHDQYDISLVVPAAAQAQPPLILHALPIVCADLLVSQGFHALIGRDVLRQCFFSYNGTAGHFTLAY